MEREFYAVNRPREEFVEIPRWVRLMHDRFFWFGGPRRSRRDALVIEAMCVGFALIGLAVPFFVPERYALRVIAIAPIIACYLVALSIRMHDRYKLWPGEGNAAPDTLRTWRTIAAEYIFFATVGVMSVVVLLWIVQ